ncbi:unnamed protein product [Pedinophyceae sp. YPF-701]|nr:unnamed protein product [Pedinophyceae sp. YPF-701]
MTTASRRLAHRAWTSYNNSLVERPILTKSLVSLAGFGLGDALAQSVTKRPEEPFRWDRTLSMAGYGFVVGGPLGHYWFGALDKYVLPSRPTSPAAVLAKVGADQLLQAPFGMACFYAWDTMAKHGREGFEEEFPRAVRETLPVALQASWTMWPLAHLINFRYIPSSQRMLYVNAVALVWTSILSYVSNKPSEPAPYEEVGKLAPQEL